MVSSYVTQQNRIKNSDKGLIFKTHSQNPNFGGVGGERGFFFFCLLGPHLWHMEVPRPGVKSELLPLAYTTATATPDPSHICNLHHSSRQQRILNPLSEAEDRTHVLMVNSQICFCCTTGRTPDFLYFYLESKVITNRACGSFIKGSSILFYLKYKSF